MLEAQATQAAVRVAQVLATEGIFCIEVALRTPAAISSIAAIASAIPEMMVGAGTVLTVRDFEAAVAAGAQFIVAPGLNPRLVERVRAAHIRMVPGISTATEIDAAMGLGCDILKFFPAEAAGGTAFLRAVSAPFPSVRFLPSGGIGPTNLEAYLALPSVIAVAGSWCVPRSAVASKDWADIRARVRAALAVAKRSRQEHRLEHDGDGLR
jgi:2-dehydro-3-deoxyphosphogluconate aldolase/(4S)-4-hydroxy-2-oxoglutarate aldolase